MSRHHLVEYKVEEDPYGKRKRALTVNGFWIVVMILILVAAIYGGIPREIPGIMLRFVNH
jgi:hypothetical protein